MHPLKGRKQTPEHIAKRTAAITGIKKGPHSEEWKKKIKESVLRAYATPEVKAKFIGRVSWNTGKKVQWSEGAKLESVFQILKIKG